MNKHIYILLVWLGIFPALTFSQETAESFTLKDPLTGNIEYIARDYIKLINGFHYNATNNESFKAYVDNGVLFAPTANTYKTPDGQITTDKTLGGVVGAIPGSFNVTGSGGASYTIPIEGVMGMDGMQPNMSLSYNSQSGYGIAGLGWSIGGLSAITKVPKNKYFDGEITGMEWDGTYALDGVRMINTVGNEYYLENDVTRKIIKIEDSNGAIYFKVNTKEGLEITYGMKKSAKSYIGYNNDVDDGGNIYTAWYIERVENKNGAYVEYNYLNDLYSSTSDWDYYKNFRIDEAIYGHTQSNKIGSVKFKYVTRTDVSKGYIDGFEVVSDMRLSSIQVKVSETTIRTYQLSYTDNNTYSWLESLELFGSDGTKYNATVFENSANNIEYQTNSVEDFIIPQGKRLLTTLTADFRGDGRSDFAYLFGIPDNNNQGGVTDVELVIFDDCDPRKQRSESYVLGSLYYDPISEGRGWPDFKESRFGDFDGDGSEDMIKLMNGNNKIGLWYFSFKENELNDSQSIIIDQTSNIKPFIDISDLTGDGIPEVIIIENNPTYFNGIYTYEANILVGWGGMVNVEFNISVNSKITSVKGGNLISNGKSDLLLVLENSNVILENIYDGNNYLASTAYQDISNLIPDFEDDNFYDLGNFNNDNLTDIIYQYDNSKWRIAYNKGNGQFVLKDYTFNSSDQTGDGGDNDDPDQDAFYICDLNGDGLADLVFGDEKLKEFPDIWGPYFNYENTIWSYYVQTKDGFSLLKSETNKIRANEVVVLDFYGKGYTNFCFKQRKNNDLVIQDINCSFKPTLLKSIETGLGSKISIVYKGLIDDNIWDDENLGEEDYVQSYNSMNNVVWSVNDGVSLMAYKYKTPVIHRNGKGFLGFLSTEINNLTTGISSITNSILNTDVSILIPQSQIQSCSRGNISINNTTFEVEHDTGNKRYRLLLTRNEVNDQLNYLTTTQSFVDANNKHTYDEYNNPKKITITKGDNTTVTDIIYDDNGAWCANKPTLTTITQTNPNGSITRKYESIYNDKGNLTLKIDDKDDPLEVRTDYNLPNKFGYATQIVSSTDAASITKTIAYTPSGRFIESETDENLVKTVSYIYNETLGILESETSEIGTITYKYNGFERLKETVYPNGTKEDNVLQWAGDEGPLEANYFAYSRSTMQSPIWTWYDKNNRKIREDYFELNGKVYVDTKYKDGRLFQVSDPYYEGDTKVWATTNLYDSFGRLLNSETPLGNIAYDYSEARTVKVTTPNSTKETILNAQGNVEKNIVNNKSVEYSYWPTGNVFTATPEDGTAVETHFDIKGNRTLLNDPNAGMVSTTYNGFGEILTNEKRGRNDTEIINTIYTYDEHTGLLDLVTKDGIVTDYEYYEDFQLKTISIDGVHSETYSYDEFNRVTTVNETIEGSKQLAETIVYDDYGRIGKKIYPSGYIVNYYYNQYSQLTSITDKNNYPIWTAVESNAKGQLTDALKGGLECTYAHDTRNLPSSIKVGNVVDMSYEFNDKAQLLSRTDNVTDNMEEFNYDSKNRLLGWTLKRTNENSVVNSMVYNPTTGSIVGKSDIKYTMHYGENNFGPHAITSVEGKPVSFSDDEQFIKYTSFKKVKEITEGSLSLEIKYGIDEQRRKASYSGGIHDGLTKYYFNNYEEEHKDGEVRKVHYISGGNGLTALYIETNGVGKLYHVVTDYQGSLIAITDKDGIIASFEGSEQRFAFDPWGNRRDPQNWTLPDNRTSWLTDRGYTMHEHLDAFGLINMNGRVYDPLLAQFLSPDPYIQSPDNWLNYNRYGYCLNNPLIYTDPDGEFWHLVIGAAIGGVFNWAANGAEFTWDGLGYFGIGAAAGALGAGVGAGISSAMATGGTFGAGFVGSSAAMTASSSFVSGAAIGAGAGFSSGFVSGAGNSWMGGSNFGEGLWSGIKTGGIGGASGALLGGIAGGMHAYDGERNFWNGDNVEIGRTRLSFNNSPVSPDKLFYVDAKGDLYSLRQFNNPINRRINTAFYTEEGTLNRLTHNIDLETLSQPRTTASVKIPQGYKIKGFAGIETGQNYWKAADGVSFTSNNGLNRIVTSGPGNFSFPSNGLRTVTGRIFGAGINDGTIFAPNTFRVIIRIK